jgi:ribonuclease HI
VAKKFYVVWQGRETGIFTEWADCKAQVEKYAGAKYKSFPTREAAEQAFDSGPSATGSRSGTGAKKKSVARKTVAGKNGVKTYDANEVAAVAADTKIFTDGGCEPNPGEAGTGVVIYRGEKLSELWFGLYNPQGTNNTAELNGLHQALIFAKDELSKKRNVVVFCDSKYAIQCITQWAAGWEKNGWTRKGGEIKNLELIQEIYQLYQSLKDHIKVLHVNGHVGVEGNELADRMSIKAISEQVSDFVLWQEPINIKEILALRAG